jgi:hypothetical protein
LYSIFKKNLRSVTHNKFRRNKQRGKVNDMTKKLRSYLTVGLMMTVGGTFFSINNTVGAQPLPPEPPAMHNRAAHAMPPQEMQGPSREEHEQILKLLGISEKKFRHFVEEGKSLEEIANKQDVEICRLVDLIEEHLRRGIDRDVREQRIPRHKAEELKEHARERAEEIVNQKPVMPPHPGHDMPPHPRPER